MHSSVECVLLLPCDSDSSTASHTTTGQLVCQRCQQQPQSQQQRFSLRGTMCTGKCVWCVPPQPGWWVNMTKTTQNNQQYSKSSGQCCTNSQCKRPQVTHCGIHTQPAVASHAGCGLCRKLNSHNILLRPAAHRLLYACALSAVAASAWSVVIPKHAHTHSIVFRHKQVEGTRRAVMHTPNMSACFNNPTILLAQHTYTHAQRHHNTACCTTP